VSKSGKSLEVGKLVTFYKKGGVSLLLP
jgi:hypothetical protein